MYVVWNLIKSNVSLSFQFYLAENSQSHTILTTFAIKIEEQKQLNFVVSVSFSLFVFISSSSSSSPFRCGWCKSVSMSVMFVINIRNHLFWRDVFPELNKNDKNELKKHTHTKSRIWTKNKTMSIDLLTTVYRKVSNKN